MTTFDQKPDFTKLTCPNPHVALGTIQIAHGGGGRLGAQLLEQVFLPALDNPFLREAHDGARLGDLHGGLALTTDSHVIRPLFFPGGDIGSLSVYGTVNDLLVTGARPLFLSAAFILEEGFEIALLERIVRSLADAARAANVSVVTGDTKVVERGHGDGVFITTTGVGRLIEGADIAPNRARPGDVVLLSGEIAAHGIAVLSAREGLGLSGQLRSDSASIAPLVLPILERHAGAIHVLRDPTRGGVSSALNEIASSAAVQIHLLEEQIPIAEPVRGACELLGLDPLYVANEGKCLAIVAPEVAESVLAAWSNVAEGRLCRQIGVVSEGPALVTLRSPLGTTRIVDMISGEQLPRIC